MHPGWRIHARHHTRAEVDMFRERIDFIKRLALEAGRLTLEGYGRSAQVPKDLQDGYDIATEYDLQTEELVKGRIQDEFGEPVLGEEDGLLGELSAAKARLWIVDPIDGTFNYQRGLPNYGVSIAYCENSIPVCGAVYLPALGQFYHAAQGEGAFLARGDASGAVPIRVSPERELVRLIIGFAGRDVYRLLAACAAEGIPRRSLRYSMCAVQDLTFIAAGRMDAYLHTSLNLWDCAATDIILREAGGPPALDYGGLPIFPHYLTRRLEGRIPYDFTFVASSSLDLVEEPLSRIIHSAGLAREDKE
jgi:myo-inositol-1(or 4)-monophosphatase